MAPSNFSSFHCRNLFRKLNLLNLHLWNIVSRISMWYSRPCSAFPLQEHFQELKNCLHCCNTFCKIPLWNSRLFWCLSRAGTLSGTQGFSLSLEHSLLEPSVKFIDTGCLFIAGTFSRSFQGTWNVFLHTYTFPGPYGMFKLQEPFQEPRKLRRFHYNRGSFPRNLRNAYFSVTLISKI